MGWLAVASVCLAFLAAVFVGVVALGASWLTDLPDYSDASRYNTSQKTRIYAGDRQTLLAEFYLEDRRPVAFDRISPLVLAGTVATEDERFYEHKGVDLWGIARAVVVNLTGQAFEGASTITQQLARNTILADEANEITLKRKLREAYISIKMEEMYSKDDILLMYLNTINYGSNSYGIEAAAQHYFSKAAIDLNLVEAATLVGIPQSPTQNNPIDNPETCQQRRNLVLNRMYNGGYITRAEHEEAINSPLALQLNNNESDGIHLYPYFSSYIRDTLNATYTKDFVYRGGLNVYTSLDLRMQEAAEQAARNKEQYLPADQEVALSAVDPDTGFIKAMVGGKDFYTDQYNLATQALRQPGSSFKTFTLIAALEAGIDPRTAVSCSSGVIIGDWPVSNYGNASYGTSSISSAFAVSSNTAFARIITEVGPSKVAEVAHRMGIKSDLGNNDPTITLGAYGVNPTEMAGAYATIANGGILHETTGIVEIVDRNGETLYKAETEGKRVLRPEIAYAATEVMKGVVTGGTGTAARLASGQVAAGKTGTSDKYRDSWFCGITPQISVALWLGVREDTPTVYDTVASVFRDFVGTVLEGSELEEFPVAELPTYRPTYEVDLINIGEGVNMKSDAEIKAEEEEAKKKADEEAEKKAAKEKEKEKNKTDKEKPKEPAKEPVKKPAKEPAKEPVKEPDKKPAEEPAGGASEKSP